MKLRCLVGRGSSAADRLQWTDSPAAENDTVPNVNEAKAETLLRTTARFPVEAVQPVF